MDRTKALTWTELRVGLLVIASLVVLALTVLYIGGGGSPFAQRYEVKALMPDVNGLKTGSPVRVGGVEVGTVAGVDFAPDAPGLVEVTLRLDQRVQPRVTTKSAAALGALGLLGEKAVDITAAVEGTPIPDGGYLAATEEDSFKSLMSDASDSTNHLKKILARLDAGQGLMGKALRDEELYDRLLDVSVRLQGLMGKLESSRGPLGRLANDEQMSTRLGSVVEGLDRLVARLDAGEGTLGMLLKDPGLAADLKAAAASLAAVSGRVERGEGTLGRLVQDDALHQRFESMATRLDALAARLEKGEGTAGRLLQDPALHDEGAAALRDLRALVADVRKDPRRYLRVKVSLF